MSGRLPGEVRPYVHRELLAVWLLAWIGVVAIALELKGWVPVIIGPLFP